METYGTITFNKGFNLKMKYLTVPIINKELSLMKTTKKQRILLLLSSGADIYTVSAKTGENIHTVKKLAKVLK